VPEPLSRAGLLLRAAFFLLVVWLGAHLFGTLMMETLGYFPAATLSLFLAAALATAFVLRVYERGRLEDVGLNWSQSALRQLWRGIGAAAAAALLTCALGLATGVATIVREPDPQAAFGGGKLIFTATLLLFGAAGEELMFRGYAFQLLAGHYGARWIVPLFAVLFGLAHMGNLNVGWLALANTALWGALLGYAMVRSGALWLPIGLHFGWNLALPLAGARLSGFTLGLTGYGLNWHGAAWLSGADYGPEGSLYTTLVCVALALWLGRSRIEHQGTLLLDARRRPASDT
jgi:membrane protease YdiL (CAAX protease family)